MLELSPEGVKIPTYSFCNNFHKQVWVDSLSTSAFWKKTTEAGTKSATSPQIWGCTTLQNLNVQLHNCSFVLARIIHIRLILIYDDQRAVLPSDIFHFSIFSNCFTFLHILWQLLLNVSWHKNTACVFLWFTAYSWFSSWLNTSQSILSLHNIYVLYIQKDQLKLINHYQVHTFSTKIQYNIKLLAECLQPLVPVIYVLLHLLKEGHLHNTLNLLHPNLHSTLQTSVATDVSLPPRYTGGL